MLPDLPGVFFIEKGGMDPSPRLFSYVLIGGDPAP